MPLCAALALGVAKEAFDVGEIGRDIEIAHSTVETFVTVLQVGVITC